ncbi:hypothetical protein WJX74_002633 [Apatococcus lobatus]|uniref:Uncharacterized protein n=1 Tax=Apatococcus lobatus TaxID=904363 RepID=A0AAW1S5B7_9CHLO
MLRQVDLNAAGLPKVASVVQHMQTVALNSFCKQQQIARWFGAGDRIRDTARLAQRQQVRGERARQQAVYLKAAIALEANNHPRFLRLLQQAHREGKLQSHAAFVQLIEGSAAGIVHGRKHRQLNDTQKAFFMSLLNYGGPLLHNTVSMVLCGPHIRSTQRWRAEFFAHGLGMDLKHFQHAADLLRKYRAQDALCVLAEDATALQAHLEPILEDSSVVVYGLNGPPVKVSSCQILWEQLTQQGVATQFYVWTLTAMMPGVPHIPLCAVAHDGSNETFSFEVAASNWERIWQLAKAAGVKLLGHCSDGDARLRRADLHLLHWRMDGLDALSIEHALVQLAAPKVDMSMAAPFCFKIATQDWLHIVWRLRVQLLQARRSLQIGSLLISATALTRLQKQCKAGVKLLYSDLNSKDKQNLDACLRLFGFKKLHPSGTQDARLPARTVEDTGIIEALDSTPDYYGLQLFLQFGHRFMRIFVIKDRSPREHAADAAWCIAFVGYWERLLRDAKDTAHINMKENFITRQTKQDVLIACNCMDLLPSEDGADDEEGPNEEREAGQQEEDGNSS